MEQRKEPGQALVFVVKRYAFPARPTVVGSDYEKELEPPFPGMTIMQTHFSETSPLRTDLVVWIIWGPSR